MILSRKNLNYLICGEEESKLMKQNLINACKLSIVDFFAPYKQNVSPSLVFFKGKETNPLYGVFTLNNQEGFVIVDFINGAPVVSAYSPEGILTEDIINNNDVLKKNFSLFETRLKNKEVMVRMDSTSPPPQKKSESFYLLSTQWAQDYPFNLFIPDNLMVGCTATAAAQIIRFFEMQPTGTLPEYESATLHIIIPEINLDSYIYDWEKMPDRYLSNITDEEKEKLSLISFHAAVGVKMDFRHYESAAYVSDSMLLMKNHFNFSPYMKHFDIRRAEDSYLDSDIRNILYFELINNRPVFLAGSSHAFIADGIDTTSGFFHFNFGLGGDSDGFYSVSRPGRWSIEEMILNIHTMTDDMVRTKETILSAESMEVVSHGDDFNISTSILNSSSRSISIAACLTTISSAFLHKISESYTLPQDINAQQTELSVKIPESASLSPRKIQLMWKYSDEEYGWRLVEPVDESMEHALLIRIIARENNEVLLSAPLEDIVNQSIQGTFTYNIKANNTTNESKAIKCILAITDKHDNIIHVVGESELTDMVPGTTTQLSLNCSLEGVRPNVMHQAKIFYTTENGYRYLMMVADDLFKNMISVWGVLPIEFRSDIIISEINNFPNDKVFTWAKPFNLEVDIITDGYTENTLPINHFEAFIYDDNYNITNIKRLTNIAIKDQSAYHLEFPISLPRTFKNGNYNFAIAFMSPQHGYRHQIIKSDAHIDNPVKVTVSQSIFTSYIRLAEDLDPPAYVNSNSYFTLPVVFAMSESSLPDDLYYMFSAEVLLTSKDAQYTIATLNGYGVSEHSNTYFNFECNVPDINPGTYIISIQVNDYYFPGDSIAIPGMDESIVSEAEIIII